MSQDTLSDVLRAVRLRGAVFFNVSSQGEWAAEAPPARELAPLLALGVDHVIEYHAVAHGTCWAGIPGGPSVRLNAGDVVLFPHGDAHVVSSTPGLRGTLDPSLFPGPNEDLPVRLTYSGVQVLRSAPPEGDAETAIVCGFLGVDTQPFNPIIQALPRLLHLPATSDTAWLTLFSQHAVAESHTQRPGGEAMLARMSEMMFVDAVRRYADSLPPGTSGWLAGLKDRFVGRSLALMHEKPAHEWTIEELSSCVGLSRSALHERFVQLIGTPPMHYLAQWRMQSAARLLLETRASVASIALEVGYDSEAAFARAFKRLVGKPPAMWRREREAAALA